MNNYSSNVLVVQVEEVLYFNLFKRALMRVSWKQRSGTEWNVQTPNLFWFCLNRDTKNTWLSEEMIKMVTNKWDNISVSFSVIYLECFSLFEPKKVLKLFAQINTNNKCITSRRHNYGAYMTQDNNYGIS